MKKILALALILCMVLCCAACGSGGDKDLLAEIKEQGYIELCTEPYFAPNEFIDPTKTGDEQYVGMDIEIAKYIADKIGVELRIVPLDFTAVLAGIADGKYDMAISAIAYSPERASAMTLSNVYKTSGGYGFMVRTEDADKYNSIEDLKDAVVITQSGSVQESLYNENVKECKDVCICSTDSAQLYADANGGLYIPEFRFEIDPNMNGTVVALPSQGSESLLEVVNEAIAELNEQGLIDQWNEEYTAYAAELGIE